MDSIPIVVFVRKVKNTIRPFLESSFQLVTGFVRFLWLYTRKKVITWGLFFEHYKNILVKFFLMKRGRYNRPFLHLIAMVVMILGVLIGPYLAETYPIFSQTTSLVSIASSNQQSIIVGEDVFETRASEKPRDKVLVYRVEKGDTISTIAQKYGISEDTIKWSNNLANDDLSIGDELKILPVTGISHKVAKGETVYSIAKKYDTEPQKIVDFPFNDFANPETFSLVEGQMVIVPDGVKPSEQPTFRRQVYLAQGPVTITSSGFTWPAHGIVSQFASWYHMAIDIAADIGTPVVAAHSGTIVKASAGTWDGGYGTSVMVDNGGGYVSNYAHLSAVNVSTGDPVVAGKTILGWIGMTGRTTGPHVHFEIRRNGSLVNPLPFLQ